MAISPILKTKRLLIQPFNKEYLSERYVGWLNNKELMRYSEQRHRNHSLESCWQYYCSFEDSLNYFWAIEEVKDGLGHIGNINAYIDRNNSIADIGIVIGEKRAQHRGFAEEVMARIIDYLFDDCGIRKITAGTMAVNKPMLRLMTKIGMRKDGRRKRHYLFNGKEVDIIFMALFLDDWLTVQSKQASTHFSVDLTG